MRSAAWCNQDLFFLTDALRRGGMSYAEVAGFLGRDVGEVRDEANRLGVESRHLASKGNAERLQARTSRSPSLMSRTERIAAFAKSGAPRVTLRQTGPS
jgi:hypothetical protein